MERAMNRGKTLFRNGQWLVDEDELQNIFDNITDDDDSDLDQCDISDIPADIIDPLINPLNDNTEETYDLNWRLNSFVQQNLPKLQSCSVQIQIKHPHQYFAKYFNDEHFENAALYTSMYYMKKSDKELKTSAREIKILYGMFIIMGCLTYPRISMYWKKGYNLAKVSSQISKNRFKMLRSSLHYVDLDEVNTSDILWKVNPIVNAVRDQCLSITRDIEHYSVDEQMIPFTGRCPIRQYVKNKPRPVGLKNFVIATSSGLVLDFIIYIGTTTNLPNKTLGLGPGVVMRLVESIPQGSFIYFDRYFTTVSLMKELLNMGYKATGTIMYVKPFERRQI